MGLFDFFKKSIQSISNTKQETPVSTNADKTTITTNQNKATMPQPQNKEISFEQEAPPSLDSLIEKATPSKQGLYPHEIMMLEYAPHFKISNNSFQNFWYWQYSITEPQLILDSLYERDFIKIGDLRSALEKLKLPEIKEELKAINQKVSGKKEELISRLLENGDVDALDKKYTERYYVLTPKGEEELKDNQYVSYLHRKRYMSVWEMNLRIAQTHYPYRDILWGYFNEQSGIHFQNFDFGLYRNTRLNMYQFLMEENKPKTAFHLLCEVLSFDLSGLSNSEKFLFECEQNNPEIYLSIYESRFEHFFPYDETSLIIPPAISTWFVEMQSILELDDSEYKKAILEALDDAHPPRRIFTNEECADIIIADIHGNTDTLTKIYQKAEIRERARLKEIKSKL